MNVNESAQLIRLADATRQRWRNDGGWTREIHREGGAEDWSWRLSIAEVEADGPFSRFPGIDREIVLLSGAGMRLQFDGRAVELVPEAPRLRFAGEAAVDCTLLDGPTTDFNLMWSREHVQADSWLRPLVGGSVLSADAGETWVVHLLAGQLRPQDAADTAALAPGDTLILRTDGQRRRQRIEAAGTALFVRLRASSTESR